MLEIYQPLIVGFLAVSLGFVASAGLEIWKDRIRSNAAMRELRKALIFEFRIFRQAIEMELNPRKASGDLYHLEIYFPLILDQINRSGIGALSYPEVCALADFTQMKERVHAIVDGDEGSKFENNYLTLRFAKDQLDTRRELVDRFILRSKAVLEELERTMKSPIDWRRPLPDHLQNN